MKLFTCLAHVDPQKLPYVAQVLKMQERLMDEVHVYIITNKTKAEEIDLIYSFVPPQTNRFKVEVVNRDYDKLPSPWLLTWVHKQLMLEKFADPTYTHFMCIEDDMEVTQTNVNYWISEREKLKPYNIYPSFMRVEWSKEFQQWAMTDSMKGDIFSVCNHPKLNLIEGYGYINLGRTYQGMFFYDRELMEEHIQSISFYLERFIPDWQARILHTGWPLGLTEQAVFALTHINVPPGCISRNFLPYYTKYNMIDPCCFVHHLPDEYINISDMDHGKVLTKDILCP